MYKKVTAANGAVSYLPTETANELKANPGQLERLGFKNVSDEEYELKPVQKGRATVNDYVPVKSELTETEKALIDATAAHTGKTSEDVITAIKEATAGTAFTVAPNGNGIETDQDLSKSTPATDPAAINDAAKALEPVKPVANKGGRPAKIKEQKQQEAADKVAQQNAAIAAANTGTKTEGAE